MTHAISLTLVLSHNTRTLSHTLSLEFMKPDLDLSRFHILSLFTSLPFFISFFIFISVSFGNSRLNSSPKKIQPPHSD